MAVIMRMVLFRNFIRLNCLFFKVTHGTRPDPSGLVSYDYNLIIAFRKQVNIIIYKNDISLLFLHSNSDFFDFTRG